MALANLLACSIFVIGGAKPPFQPIATPPIVFRLSGIKNKLPINNIIIPIISFLVIFCLK
jgi:hypothetical protein